MSKEEEYLDYDNDSSQQAAGSSVYCHSPPAFLRQKQSVMQGAFDDDPFDKLEQLIIQHSSTTKRSRLIQKSSPDVSVSDESEGPKKIKRDFTPPVIRFGPIPIASESAKFLTSSAPVVIYFIKL